MLLGKAYPLQTKMIEIYTHLVFRPKRLKHHTETYLVTYRYYTGVPSPSPVPRARSSMDGLPREISLTRTKRAFVTFKVLFDLFTSADLARLDLQDR